MGGVICDNNVWSSIRTSNGRVQSSKKEETPKTQYFDFSKSLWDVPQRKKVPKIYTGGQIRVNVLLGLPTKSEGAQSQVATPKDKRLAKVSLSESKGT
jgi:hypothetical protein